jgi:protein SCO1
MTRRALAIYVLLAIAPRSLIAQPAPGPIVEAGIDERVGAQVPLDPRFSVVGQGEASLRTLVDGSRPVVLVLAYARCTMLCSLVLRGVVDAARRAPVRAGRDYQLLLIGLDARETIDEAARKQAALLAELERAGERSAWPYLVGTRASIDAVADALGFRYAWDPRTEQYAHPAVIFVLTPDGRVSRYLHGVQFDPDELARAVRDANAGKTVSTAAAEVLRCFRFDPASRRVGELAERVLQVGAGGVCAALVAMITALVLWERRRARRLREGGEP